MPGDGLVPVGDEDSGVVCMVVAVPVCDLRREAALIFAE